MFRFNLGDEVKDRITGFKGIVTSRTEWLNGCIRYGVTPQKLKDGAIADNQHFDEEQVDLVKAGKVKIGRAPEKAADTVASPASRPGGPRDDAALRRRDITR